MALSQQEVAEVVNAIFKTPQFQDVLEAADELRHRRNSTEAPISKTSRQEVANQSKPFTLQAGDTPDKPEGMSDEEYAAAKTAGHRKPEYLQRAGRYKLQFSGAVTRDCFGLGADKDATVDRYEAHADSELDRELAKFEAMRVKPNRYQSKSRTTTSDGTRRSLQKQPNLKVRKQTVDDLRFADDDGYHGHSRLTGYPPYMQKQLARIAENAATPAAVVGAQRAAEAKQVQAIIEEHARGLRSGKNMSYEEAEDALKARKILDTA